MVKFRSVSNGSSSSDESNAGLVRWNNRGSCDKDVSSINSLSTSSLSSSSSINSSLSKLSLRSMSASSLSLSSISSSSSAESINTKKNVNFHLDSMSHVKRSAWTKKDPKNSSDDDSIIFADENENPTEAKQKKSSVKTTDNKPDNEKKNTKLKRKLSEKLDESADDYKSKRISTKFKRQFIYIQVNPKTSIFILFLFIFQYWIVFLIRILPLKLIKLFKKSSFFKLLIVRLVGKRFLFKYV